MKIIVCIKAVPGFIQNPSVSPSRDRIDYEAGSTIINESDDYALEAGLKLARASGGEITVLTAGSLSAQKVLQIGLAKDAHKAVRVDVDMFDSAHAAQALAAAVKRLEFDLILTGVESRDSMAAQVGVSMAELLGLPFAYAVTRVEPGQKAGALHVTKELGFGEKQLEEITLPALLCIQTGTVPPGFVPIRKMMMAQSKPITTFSPADLDWEEVSAPLPRHKVLEFRSPQDTAAAEIIPGSPPEAAAVLMKKIREVL